MSCSLERPPASTATRRRLIGQPKLAYERGGVWGTGRFPTSSRRRGLVGETWFPPRERAAGERSSRGRGGRRRVRRHGVGRRRRGDEPPDHDRDGCAGLSLRAARGLLGDDDPLEGRVVGVLVDDLDLEAGRLERRARCRLVGRASRRARPSWPALRDRERHRRPLRSQRVAVRLLADHDVLRLVVLDVTARHGEAGTLELRRRLVVEQPDDGGHRDGFGPVETLIRTVEPSMTTVPLRGPAPSPSGIAIEGTSTTFGSSPAFVSASTASSRARRPRRGS